MKFLLIGIPYMALILSSPNWANAQDTGKSKPMVTVWEGMIVAGYVDRGGYINFGGPSIKLVCKPWSFGFGILPTMRIKEDKVAKGLPKNSPITPTAGFGFTVAYRRLVVQLPFYYNNKTADANGKWNPGAGLGYRF